MSQDTPASSSNGDAAEMIYTSDDRGSLLSLEPRSVLHMTRTSKRHAAVIGMLVRNDRTFLLQWRSSQKLGGSRLDVSATTHIRKGETYESAVRRSFKNELGVSGPLELDHLFDFVYEEELGERKENEFCRVFRARYDGNYSPNPDEIDKVEFMSLQGLKAFVRDSPGSVTKWLRETVKRL